MASRVLPHLEKTMSASEFRIPYQQVSSSQTTENAGQFKICRCGEGDPNTNTSETGDKSPTSCPNCQVLKSGHLLLSSKGIGWTTWKKRWFILTRASLVFFRSDPNAPPRGNEPIVTLGGIDLNNSGSVVVKEDKKLLTVLFPDGRDGRTFTLKAETTEELNEWRSALENALAQAPVVANTVGQNPIFSTDIAEPAEAPAEQSDNKSIIGRPAEFALVDADGSPAFLEKALKFIEDYGVKVEGILRQSADVEEVKRRVRDYEKGKNEFSPEEDAHVIGDCIKYVLREMPSSPVPAPCCTALVGAYRTDKTRRLDAMNRVIYEVFPEPNRQLLQRMSQSALAACMAPLLLRPLLLGECEIDSDFSMAGDGSFQLLQAAAAANHAQAIVIIMLEEYDQIFDDLEDGSYSSDAYTESEDGDFDKEYSTDNDGPEEDDSYDSGEDNIEEDMDDDTEHSSGGSECDNNIKTSVSDDKVKSNNSGTASNGNDQGLQPPKKAARTGHGAVREDTCQIESNDPSNRKQELYESNGSTDQIEKLNVRSSSARAKFMEKSSSSRNKSKKTLWGRTSARKDLSAEEIDYCSDDETLIEKLENSKTDLQSKITKEVENLRDQLQKERNLRVSLESGLMNLRRGQASFPSTIDNKTKADLEEVATAEADILNLKQKGSDLRGQLNNQVQMSSASLCDSCNKRLLNTDKLTEGEQSTTSSNVGPNSISDMVSATHMDSGAPSALAKLTNRLNFLKERRAILASEMQNLDLARPPGPPAPAPKRDST
uniref:Rho-GAP domain-containing protein n=1 Tax=Oryza glumipatula TaxID=40148 RepID=A0A0D9Z4V8_9ORYZ